ncbi:Fe2+-enterobactin ABC transporter substrate-binding protein [Xenorhabdus bovienii]|uniref:Fe2+-enterobactin ABC transporter substrate-binding protein n=1 Tax=Xenorhabdus bovienii TaxID=40576 RepID=UPI00237C95F5|nr:Fe2+-enterobactin ABC transporter substrate-binding protein [Xenorhabdus bovienii]MDE1494801.1 Fe2+-enterobactin ABC transporter substrate-binding protein [Xenorhabdus bovienii]MDE9473899.1 Fe2+-enterobactin ABC transporter substrate-binding protein [Xenorhabdus bovienii]
MQCKFTFSYYRLITVIFAFIAIVLTSGCDKKSTEVKSGHPQLSGEITGVAGWPRTFETAKGPLTLTQPPKRIVSTSVTLSGTLLAINAPLIASGATGPNTDVADSQGFFIQWAKVAYERGVKLLYISEPNAEAVAVMVPDLIVISATGGDSAMKLYEQLSTIAPILVIDYGDKSWQQLALQLGQIIGHEADAGEIIARFEQRLQKVKQGITLPPNPVSAFVYYADGRGVNLWTPSSAQGQLLHQLGFTLATLPTNLKTETSMGKREDIIQLSAEGLADGLNGQSFMLFATNDSTIQAVNANPFLQHLPAVNTQRLYAMGPDTFRLDYYSANNMLDRIEHYFSNQELKN